MGKYKRELPRKDLVAFERNMAEWPFYYPGRGKTPPKMEHNFDIKNRNGVITGKGNITVENAEGIPGPFEKDLVFIFSKYYREQGNPKEIEFSRYGIAKDLGKKWNGRTKEQINKGVICLYKTSNIIRGIGQGPLTVEMGFHTIEGYTFYERKEHLVKKGIPYTAAREVNYARFSDLMREAFEKRIFKLMDPAIYLSLPCGLSRYLYLYLEKKGLWKKGLWPEKIRSLSNHLGLNMEQNIYELTRTIDRAIDTLKKKKVISCGRNEDKRIFSPYKKR